MAGNSGGGGQAGVNPGEERWPTGPVSGRLWLQLSYGSRAGFDRHLRSHGRVKRKNINDLQAPGVIGGVNRGG